MHTRCGYLARALQFTLIEMLVVISIIGILMAMLMPSLQGALRSARSSLCQNNIRQDGIAMLAYSDDYGGWGTFSHYMHYLMGPIYSPQAKYTLIPYLGADAIPTSAGGTLKDFDVLPVGLCPEGRRDGTDSITVSSDFDTPNGSYSFTVYLTAGPPSVSTPRFGRITTVKRPSNRILCADVASATSSSRPNALYNHWQFADRHNGGNNICHVDGHVKYYSYFDSVDLGSGSNPCPDGTWHDLK